jgi:PKD repeat protein
MSKVMLSRVPLLVVLAASAACTVHPQEIPPLAGPSELALALVVAATPDRIAQDGISQSRLVATLRDADGKPVVNRGLQVLTAVNNSIANFGTLSATTVFTGADGTATVVYTAPATSSFMTGTASTRVSIYFSPIGTNYQTANFTHVDILVTPPPVPVPGPGAPIASVSMSPSSPKIGQNVLFDASSSTPGAGHQLVNYYWEFGDGLPNDEHGSDASHTYTSVGTFTMVLGVVDEAGQISSTYRTVIVTP